MNDEKKFILCKKNAYIEYSPQYKLVVDSIMDTWKTTSTCPKFKFKQAYLPNKNIITQSTTIQEITMRACGNDARKKIYFRNMLFSLIRARARCYDFNITGDMTVCKLALVIKEAQEKYEVTR